MGPIGVLWLITIVNDWPPSGRVGAYIFDHVQGAWRCTLGTAQRFLTIMTYKRFPDYWPFVRGIHRSPAHRDRCTNDIFFIEFLVWWRLSHASSHYEILHITEQHNWVQVVCAIRADMQTWIIKYSRIWHSNECSWIGLALWVPHYFAHNGHYHHCLPVSSHKHTHKTKQKLEQLERLRSEDTPRRLMITHTIESCWVPNQNKVEWPWRYRSRSKVITCDKPSHASDHLCQIWKESIRNCRCYRADTIFKAKAKWPWRYRSRSKVIICNTLPYTSGHLC